MAMPASRAPSDALALRPADPAEAPLLTALAVRSKRSWGYDRQFMAAALPDLEVTAGTIARHTVDVALIDGRIAGFVTLDLAEDGAATEAEILQLFVDPSCQGCGVGRALLARAFETATARGAGRVTVESDPYAAAFYEAAGMVRTGAAASIVDPARRLPVLTWRPPSVSGTS